MLLLTPLSVDPKANSIGAAMYFMGCNLASNQLGERKKWRSFKRFQLIVRRGSLGNSAAELSAAGCEGCNSVVQSWDVSLWYFDPCSHSEPVECS